MSNTFALALGCRGPNHGIVGQPADEQSAERKSVPALLCKHATELIQWLAPNSRRRSLRADHRRSGPRRQHRRHEIYSDVIGKMGLYWAVPAPGRGGRRVCRSRARDRLAPPPLAFFSPRRFWALLILRRSGRNDFDRFRDAFRRDGIRAIHLESPGLGPCWVGSFWYFRALLPTPWAPLLLVPAVRRQLRAADRPRARRTAAANATLGRRSHAEGVAPSFRKADQDGRPSKRVR